MRMGYEVLEEVLKVASERYNINAHPINIDNTGFTRDFKFTVDEKDYKITWYVNQSALISDNLRVMFQSIRLCNTWPSPAGASMKLEFRDYNNEVVAVLPIAWRNDEEEV